MEIINTNETEKNHIHCNFWFDILIRPFKTIAFKIALLVLNRPFSQGTRNQKSEVVSEDPYGIL